MARNATELALARAETTTRFHLLDLTDQIELTPIVVCPDEDCQKSVKRQTRSEVEELMAGPGEPEPALEMALLTDRLPQRGSEAGRIHDRQVGPGRTSPPIRVQRAWTVTALASDGVAFEDGRLVTVQGPGRGTDLVRVAEQALALDGALEVRPLVWPP